MPTISTLAAAVVICGSMTATAQQSRIRHVVVSVAATNDEWTTTGLTIGGDDIVIVSAHGTINVGGMIGEVDASGARPGSSSSTGSGVLEYKVGVSAGKPAGAFALLRGDLRGELKFRVKDNRYDDNSGAFEVEVVVIPQSAIPPATRVGDEMPADLTNPAVRVEQIKIKSYLSSLLTAQETFFTDSNRYTNKLSELSRPASPEGSSIKMLTASRNSWSVIVTSIHLPGIECGVAVAMVNPIDRSAGEGEPVCKSK